MAEQLTFDLPAVAALGREDFFVAPANAHALEAIEAWRSWPLGRCLLSGPAGSGKSHLAHVWAGQAGARVVAAGQLPAMGLPDGPVAVEGIDSLGGEPRLAEALFHLVNHAQAAGLALLLTAREGFRARDVRLPDLESRLAATFRARIEAPDDSLLAAVLVKQFADRQIAVSPAVISWLVPRMERSLTAAARVVEALDRESLAAKAPITQRLAARVLDKLQAAPT